MQEAACGWDCAVGLGLCGPGEGFVSLACGWMGQVALVRVAVIWSICWG